MTHEIRAVIFDLDGTLLDTETISTVAIEKILAQYDIFDFNWDLKKLLLGLRGPQWTDMVINHYNIQHLVSPQSFERQWEDMLKQSSADIQAMLGANDLIDKLNTIGIKQGIATSSNKESVSMKASNHRGIFDKMSVIVCGDDVEVRNGKPSPDIYLVAANRLGVSPHQCLVFEDALSGVQAGVAAGMHVIACPDERLPVDQFLQLTPHV
eukprot:gene9227-12440_t